MGEGWNLCPGLLDLCKIKFRNQNARFGSPFGDDFTPRRNDQAVAIGGPAIFVRAALRCSKDETAGFDGSCAGQYVPMGLAGLFCKSRWYGDDLRA